MKYCKTVRIKKNCIKNKFIFGIVGSRRKEAKIIFWNRTQHNKKYVQQ